VDGEDRQEPEPQYQQALDEPVEQRAPGGPDYLASHVIAFRLA
jgi:hypothetical protein